MSSRYCGFNSGMGREPGNFIRFIFAFGRGPRQNCSNSAAMPMTQVSVERVFSSWKYVLNNLRMRFGDDALMQAMPFCFFVLIIKIE